MDLTDIIRAFHLKAAIEYMLGHKTSLSKFKKTEITLTIFSNGIKLEINYKKNTEKHTNTWRLSNMLLNNEYVNDEIKEEMERYIEINENKNTPIPNLCDTEKAVLRGKFIAIQAYLKKHENLK